MSKEVDDHFEIKHFIKLEEKKIRSYEKAADEYRLQINISKSAIKRYNMFTWKGWKEIILERKRIREFKERVSGYNLKIRWSRNRIRKYRVEMKEANANDQ